VIFQVRDQGRGIPPDVQARVFERFESHTLGTRHRGVGLGLSIVRSFVELHGGRIDLASAPGAGTVITCTFPSDGGAHRIAAE
jgi:signal transduction histidine kinase